jgi:hypothetical protein
MPKRGPRGAPPNERRATDIVFADPTISRADV